MTKRGLSLGFLIAVLPLAALGAAGDEASAVADAAMERDFAGVRALVEQDADVNAPQADGSTALHWAAYWDDLEVADLLLQAGADPRAATRLGATPMSLAAEGGSPAMIAKLLAAGVDPNTPFLANGETALMLAARSGSLESVRILLDAGADLEAKDTLRETTALIWAADQTHAPMVSLLLARGANPAAASKVNLPAEAAEDADPDLDADPNALPANHNARGGVSALMAATREGSLETVKALLDGGAPIDQQAANGATALLVAMQNGDAEIGKLLLERGADPNIASGKGWTPLYLAVKARTRDVGTVPNPDIDPVAMMDVIKLLVEHGADVNARLRDSTERYGATSWLREAGGTAFLRAAWCADLAVMKYLLEHGADPHIATFDGTNALMALAGVGYGDGFSFDFGPQEESLEAMKLLVEVAGIDVNAVNDEKITALHGAAHKNFLLGIQYLVDQGADLTLRSERSGGYERLGAPPKTVLDWAMGVQVNLQSPSVKPEAVELLTKLLQERGLPLETSNTTTGGLNFGQRQAVFGGAGQ